MSWVGPASGRSGIDPCLYLGERVYESVCVSVREHISETDPSFTKCSVRCDIKQVKLDAFFAYADISYIPVREIPFGSSSLLVANYKKHSYKDLSCQACLVFSEICHIRMRHVALCRDVRLAVRNVGGL